MYRSRSNSLGFMVCCYIMLYIRVLLYTICAASSHVNFVVGQVGVEIMIGRRCSLLLSPLLFYDEPWLPKYTVPEKNECSYFIFIIIYTSILLYNCLVNCDHLSRLGLHLFIFIKSISPWKVLTFASPSPTSHRSWKFHLRVYTVAAVCVTILRPSIHLLLFQCSRVLQKIIKRDNP